MGLGKRSPHNTLRALFPHTVAGPVLLLRFDLVGANKLVQFIAPTNR